jgi:hypothetical protein
MLRTMNFRAKLLGILAVPVLALIGITVFAGTDRVVQAQDASSLQHLITVVSTSTGTARIPSSFARKFIVRSIRPPRLRRSRALRSGRSGWDRPISLGA